MVQSCGPESMVLPWTFVSEVRTGHGPIYDVGVRHPIVYTGVRRCLGVVEVRLGSQVRIGPPGVVIWSGVSESKVRSDVLGSVGSTRIGGPVVGV